MALKRNTVVFAKIRIFVENKELFWEIALYLGAYTLLFEVQYCGILGKYNCILDKYSGIGDQISVVLGKYIFILGKYSVIRNNYSGI